MQWILPNPISTNRLYRYVGGRVLISREGRQYREAVAAILNRQRVRPLTGPLSIEIDIHPPTNREYDLDNRLKCLFDSLEHAGAFLNDSQIVRLSANKCSPIKGGLAIVRLEEIDGSPLSTAHGPRSRLPKVQPIISLTGTAQPNLPQLPPA
jgi:Holliday junction resolvase RusA-like endonuclease